MQLNDCMIKCRIRENRAAKDLDVLNRIELSVKNLTSNAGLFLLLEHARSNGIFDMIDHDLVFETQATNRIKMNRIS